jgi:ditrans,polycis-polyprenyl diphosphate synthase
MIAAIRRGPVPQHIAIIMDGNRRYARSNRVDTAEGHYSGAETLKQVATPGSLRRRGIDVEILEASLRAGVKVVTVFAFSIENFKRSKYEVDILMDLAKSHLTQLAAHGYPTPPPNHGG